MKKYGAILGALLVFLSIGLVSAAAITAALNRTDVVITNNTGANASDLGLAFNLSTVNMIDGSFVNADCLDCAVQQSDETIGFMPGSDRVRVLAAFNNAAGDETTAANNSTSDDMTLPATGSEVYEFAFDHQAKYLRLHLSTPAVASSYVVTWQYWNGSAYVNLANVIDHTNSLSEAGENGVMWDFPAAGLWPASTLHSVEGYWIQASVAASGVTQAPLGERAYYETGRWWVWEANIPDNDSRIFNLYTGGPDHVDSHQWFPGADGATTTDSAGIELGNTYSLEVSGRLNASHPTTGSGSGGACLACKDGAFELYWSSATALTLDVTGSGGQSLTITPTLGTTGSHQVLIVSDGSTMSLISGGQTDTAPAETILDNASPWVWADENTLVYVTKIGIGSPDFETTTSQGAWDGGTKTAVTSYAGAREDVSQATIPPRSFQPQVPADTGEWQEVALSFDDTAVRVLVGQSTNPRNGYFRLPNVEIDQGATIQTAQMRCRCSPSGPDADLVISALADDDADSPTNYTEAESPASGRTSASVAWTPANGGQKAYQTPNIAAVIQEVIDRPGWVNGNAIVVYWEDDGGTDSLNSIDAISSTQNYLTKPVLWVELLEDTTFGLDDNFIEMERTLQLTNSLGWTVAIDDNLTNLVEVYQVDQTTGSFGQPAAHHSHSARLGSASSSAFEAEITQNIAAGAGEIWSVGSSYSIVGGPDSVFGLRWLDVNLAVLSTDSVSMGASTSSYWEVVSVENKTAPAGTVWVQAFVNVSCVGGCSSDYGRVDGLVACEQATAPLFPNPCNELVDGSFEGVFDDSVSLWQSASFVLNASSVADTWVSWDADTPAQDDTSSYVVEGSLDASNWTPLANGDDFPGVSVGDDISAQNLHIRITFTSVAHRRSAWVTALQVGVLDADGNILRYAPIAPIGEALIDRAPLGNDSASLTLPVTLDNYSAVIQSTEATTPTTPTGATVDPVDALPEIEIIASITGDATAADDSGLIWFTLFDFAADNTGFPKQAMLFGFALVVTLMATFGAWMWSRNMWIAWGAMVFFLAVFSYGIPLLPIWVMFLAGIFGLVFPVTSSRSAI